MGEINPAFASGESRLITVLFVTFRSLLRAMGVNVPGYFFNNSNNSSFSRALRKVRRVDTSSSELFRDRILLSKFTLFLHYFYFRISVWDKTYSMGLKLVETGRNIHF